MIEKVKWETKGREVKEVNNINCKEDGVGGYRHFTCRVDGKVQFGFSVDMISFIGNSINKDEFYNAYNVDKEQEINKTFDEPVMCVFTLLHLRDDKQLIPSNRSKYRLNINCDEKE